MALTTLVEATLVPHKLSTADSFSTKRYKERYKKEMAVNYSKYGKISCTQKLNGGLDKIL